MTLAEANDLFEGWEVAPPVSILLKALVEGFGGATPRAEAKPEGQSATEGATPEQLNELALKAGPALPVMRGKDRDLPAKPPVFDFGEMRERNKAIIVKRALKGREHLGKQ